MASKYQTIGHPNIGGGVDRRSTYNNIPQGFAENMKNMDTNSTGYVRKRKGYQRYNGELPLRITKIIDATGNYYEVHFDQAINLLSTPISPIVVVGWIDFDTLCDIVSSTTTVTYNSDFIGKVGDKIIVGGETRIIESIDSSTTLTINEAFSNSIGGNDLDMVYTTEVEIYWTDFVKPVPQTMPAATAVNTLTQGHTYGIAKGMSRIVLTDGSDGTVDNQWMEPDSVEIDTEEITTIFDTTHLAEDVDVYVFNDQEEVEGRESYYKRDTALDAVDIIDNVLTVTISAADHNFSNLNIIPELYVSTDSYATISRIVPDQVEIDIDGNIEFQATVTEDELTGSDVDWEVQIHALPASRSMEDEAVAGTNTIIFDDVSNPFNFVSVFIRDELTGDGEYLAFPEEVRYVEDGDTGRIEVDITCTSAVTVHITYMEGYLSANSILVDSTSVTNINTDEGINNLQACVYGIAQDAVFYRSADSAGGHTNALAEYSSEGVNKLVVGMGGMLFEEQNQSLAPITLPSSNVSIRRRVHARKIIGPFFGKTTPRGVTASNLVNSYYADIAYISNDGVDDEVTITLNLTDKSGSLSDLILKDDWNAGEGNDKLTIAAAGNSWYVGTFDIISVDDSANKITVEIPNIPTHIRDEENVGGSAYIDTDYIELRRLADGEVTPSVPNFESGDTLNSSLFVNKPTVIGNGHDNTTSYILFLSGVDAPVSVPALSNMTGTRTTDVIPVDNTDYFLNGDVLNIVGFDRKFVITDVDTTNLTITIDEEIIVRDIADVDRTVLTVSGRWKAIESPDSPVLNESTIDYFDEETYGQKTRIRSASLNDSLYFTDYNNEVMKYDGANLYRAGLPNWQPRSHSWVDPDDEVITLPTYQYDQYVYGSSVGYLQFLSADAMPNVAAGDRLWVDENTITADFYTIDKVDRTDLKIYISAIETAIPTSSINAVGTVSSPVSIAYYFKLQMYDRNNNIIASAVTDYQECIVELAKSGKVYHRFYGMPKLDTYDYDRIDLMMYRTAMAETITPIFYQIHRQPLDYKSSLGVQNIILTDSLNNISLPIGQSSNDRASVGLKGAEQPLSTEQPPRAKYITSAANRLILGNIKSYNQLEVFLDDLNKSAELNVLDHTTIKVDSTEDSKSFRFVPALVEDDLNTDHLHRVTELVFGQDNEIDITLGVELGIDDELVGKYIQLDSFYVKYGTGNGVYKFGGRTVENELGEILGWFKVLEHEVDAIGGTTNLKIKCKHNRNTTHTLSDTGADTILYVVFDNDYGSIPIVAYPYQADTTAATVTHDIVEDLGFRDNKNIIKYTNAIDRGVRDFKRAFNQVMLDIDDPWAIAKAGPTEGAGTFIINAVKSDESLGITITPDTNGANINIYVNQLRTNHDTLASGITYVYPSRLIISKENYPEMLDAPFALSRIYSDTLVDVNSDDGQEITGFSTFFGASSNSGSQLEETLIVFKNRSVYAVQLSTGLHQKLESMEQGCTIPDSISPVKNGIMFANASGLYIVNRDLTVTYIGEFIEDYWNEDIDKDNAVSQAVGFTDSTNRKYKLSIPRSGDSLNDEVVVFDYIGGRRQESEGAWAFYDNFPATAWVQTNTAVYFSDYDGRVYSLRDLGDATDLRDDSSGIASEFLYGATAFGDSGSRVALSKVITHLKAVTDLTGAKIYIATDMENGFTEAGTLEFDKDEVDSKKLYSIAASLPDSHCLFVQVKYTHSTKDEDMVIAGLEYKAMPLSELGIKQTIDSATAR